MRRASVQSTQMYGMQTGFIDGVYNLEGTPVHDRSEVKAAGNESQLLGNTRRIGKRKTGSKLTGEASSPQPKKSKAKTEECSARVQL